MYLEAGYFRRFFAYLIDVLAVFLIFYLFAVISSIFMQPATEFPKELYDYTNSANFTFSGLIELINTNQTIKIYFEELIPYFIINTIFVILLYILYFIIIPSIFKNFQTIGRYITKTLVVKNPEGYLVSFKEHILRFLAEPIILLLNMFLGIGIFLNFFFLFTKNRTLGDIFANTKFIYVGKTVEEIFNIETKEDKNDEDNFSSEE